jgi:UDP-glucose 4-epimerase
MILVTGGMGFIGLHTAKALLDAGEKEVVITYFQTWREPDFIKDEYDKRIKIEKVDVTDLEGLLALGKKYDITNIAHLAVTGLGAYDAIGDMRVNLNGLMNILEAATTWGVKRISLASSIAIYSSVTGGPFKENIPLPVFGTGNPTETYKKVFEVVGGHIGARSDVEVINLRIGGIWGPLYHTMANLPSRLVHAAVKGEDPKLAEGRGGVPYADDQADFCYVKDCADGITRIVRAETLAHKTYNISSGNGATNQELADAITKVIPEAKFEFQAGNGPNARKDPYGDLTQVNADVGYQPGHTLETAVADYIGWLRAGNER